MRCRGDRSARVRGSRRVALLAGLAALAAAGIAAAQDRFVEDIQVSRSGGEAQILIRLACPMRFQADVPTEAGALIEVRVAPFEACRQLGGGGSISSELYRPVSGRLAHLAELEYESLGFGDSLIMLHFDEPVSYRIRQRADLRSLEVTVDLGVAPTLTEIEPRVSQAAPEPAPAVETPRAPSPDRRPLTSRVVEPAVTADYMINLQSTRDPPTAAVTAAAGPVAGRNLYVSEIEVAGEDWYRLRLGFFESEEAAAAALAPLREGFPRAWIGRAEPDEVASAPGLAVQPGSRARPGVFVAEADTEALPPPTAETPTQPLDPGRVDALLEQGRAAMLAEDYVQAIEIYSTLVAAPGEHRAGAREFLGLAYERSGRSAEARAEYQQYLAEFPSGEDATRVRQRLAGLVMAGVAPRDPLRSPSPSSEGRWSFDTGLSQYYRRDINQFDRDQPEITTLSAIFTDVDFSMTHEGSAFDVTTRLSLSQMHDMLGDNPRGDQERYSYAYLELAPSDGDWSLELGRQSLHTFGVLGRFDGAHFTYGFAPDMSLHVTAGYPVESTRDTVETDRQFYGVAVEFDDLVGDWDLSASLNAQTIEGIDARMAVGTEIRYFDDKRSLTGLIDYDVDFGELNSVLVLGTWRIANRLTLSALLDDRKSPILTTRNALIGQPVATIDELLLVWTEDEIRQLAVDRTAANQTVTLGLATPLGERFQLNFDATTTEIEGTIASGGVPAIPGTGAETYYSSSLVGTSLFKNGDVTILNLRVGSSERFESKQLTWDMRFPIGRRIRINPRLRYSIWTGLEDGRERKTLSPGLRFLMTTRNRYRIELELGTDTQTRTDLGGESEATGSFVNLGYRANF